MAGKLKGRLARMRELGLVKAAELGADEPRAAEGKGGAPVRPARGGAAGARGGKGASRPTPAFLEGWERVADFAWSRTVRKRDILPDSIDAAPFRRLRAGAASGRRPGNDQGGGSEAGAEPGRIDTYRLRFFDFETTGLSGGTGTIAFLAAVARRDGEGLAVRQLFLEDYPGELAFLEALLGEFDEDAVLVTYNGSSFDLPLLRTRCVMNGRRAPARPHIDALFAARRLWKRVHGGASLGLLEREVLGVEREEDVPGSMIPGLYFSYLRSGDEPLMRAVLSHNAEDVASLAALLARADSIFSEPRARAHSSSVDRAGLGRTLLAVGREPEGEELLEAALGDGDEAAGLLLSAIYRRAGRDGDRRRALAMLPDSYRSDLERAKFFERRDRDYGEALVWAGKARALAPTEAAAEALDRRIARLKLRAAADPRRAASRPAGRKRP